MNYELRESKARSIKAANTFLHPNHGVYPFYARSLFSLPKLVGRHVSSLVNIWKDLAH